MCNLITQQANKLVATEMKFWKRPAMKSRKEEFRNDTNYGCREENVMSNRKNSYDCWCM